MTARFAYTLSAILLGQAIRLSVRGFSAVALALVTAAIVLTAIGVFWVPPKRAEAMAQRALKPLVVLGILAALAQLPFQQLHPAYPSGDGVFWALAAFAVMLIVVILFARRRAIAAASFWTLIALFVLMGLTYLTLGDTRAIIDVHLVQHVGCQALARGENPFVMTFPDIYGPESAIYPKGLVIDGRVQCGFFYPPLALLFDLPAYAAGDVRYAHLLVIALAAVLIAYARPDRREFALAAMFLFTPTVFYQVRGAWIEPFLLLLLAATVFLVLRNRLALAAITLGLFLVAKQYAPFILPAAALLIPRRRDSWIGLIGLAAVAGAIVTLPFILWDPRAFFHSMTVLYVGMLRQDSISYAPLIARATSWRPTLLLPVLMAVPAMAMVLWRAPRTPSASAAASALILLCVFAFSTQSFGNYYFLAAGALCIAAAASDAACDTIPESETKDAPSATLAVR